MSDPRTVVAWLEDAAEHKQPVTLHPEAVQALVEHLRSVGEVAGLDATGVAACADVVRSIACIVERGDMYGYGRNSDRLLRDMFGDSIGPALKAARRIDAALRARAEEAE